MKHTKNMLDTYDRKRLACFFGMAFGALILMWPYKLFLFKNGYDVFVFGGGSIYRYFAVLLPAAGVMLGLIVTGKGEKHIPRFIKAYVVALIAETLCCICSWIAPDHSVWYKIGKAVIYLGSAAVLLCMCLDGEKTRSEYGLSWPTGKTAASLYVIFLFILVYVGKTFADIWIRGELKLWYSEVQAENFSLNHTITMLMLPCVFLVDFIGYFGEEYGWRYFLQPLCQKKFGVVGGTLAVGFIWGVWHIPMDWPMEVVGGNVFVFNVLGKIAYCTMIGMFIAFAYMVTKNFWVPIIIHFLNNNIPFFIFSQDSVFTRSYGEANLLNFVRYIMGILVFAIPFVVYVIYRHNHQGNADQ